MKPLRAVIFDMDGLMLDSETIYRMLWQQAAADQGFGLTNEQYTAFVGLKIEDAERMLAQAAGPAFSLPEFRANWQGRWRRYIAQHRMPRKPGLLPLLALLEQDGYLRAVATSTARAEALQSLGDLAARFDAVVTGDEVQHGKPAPDIFLLAAARLHCDPAECLVLEDSEAGVSAAHAAGMRVICVPDLKQPAPEIARKATAVYDTLDDARHWIVTYAAEQANEPQRTQSAQRKQEEN